MLVSPPVRRPSSEQQVVYDEEVAAAKAVSEEVRSLQDEQDGIWSRDDRLTAGTRRLKVGAYEQGCLHSS